MRKSVMGIFGKKQIEDKPLPYHAGVVSAMLGERISATQIAADQQRFGGAIASVLNLYSSTLGAPALLNMMAIGSGKEYSPIWDKELVRGILSSSSDSIAPLQKAFTEFAKNQISETDLANTIISCMGYSKDEMLPTPYDEGVLYTAHQILAELGERFKADTRNGMSGQDATDAYTQGAVATAFIGLLIACERAQLSGQ